MENIQVRRIGSVICAKVVIIGILTSLVTISGCGDSPESKAAKQVRQAADEATMHYQATGDFEKSYMTIQSALSKYGSKAGGKANSGYIVAGDLAFTEARKLQLSLSGMTEDTSRIVGKLSDGVVQNVFVNDNKMTFENLVSLANTEADKLKEVLDGDFGLKARLKDKQSEMQSLGQQRAQLQSKFDSLIEQRSQNQINADSKIKAAELVSGDQLVELEKQAYDLIRANTKLHIDIQQLSDQIELIDAKLQLASLMVQKYQEGVDQILESLEKVASTTDRIDPLKEQLDQAKQLVTAHESEMKDLTAQALTSLAAFEEKTQEVTDLYEKAIGHYKSIRTRDTAKQMADHQLAECYVAVADMYAVKLRDQNHLLARIQLLANVSDGVIKEALTGFAGEFTKNTEAPKQKAYENYDLAIAAYKDLRSSMSRDPETARALAKSQALAFYGKLTLADMLADYDTS
ncbi:MAG: hypothetical protein KAS23_14845, partial [Anaerohalosphaera sp.]|nr:hypothetical protein [Anaerohalosphaera sp.]